MSGIAKSSRSAKYSPTVAALRRTPVAGEYTLPVLITPLAIDGPRLFHRKRRDYNLRTMAQTTRTIPCQSAVGEPVWEIAELLPEQGEWSEKAYLGLDTHRLVEFDNGVIEVLPLPDKIHQLIMKFLLFVLEAHIVSKKLGGMLLPAGYKIRIPTGKYREPDLIYMSAEQEARSNRKFTTEAQLAVEIVSPDDPDRDYVKKHREYAMANVSEYWIVDGALGQILVFRLENGAYVRHGCFVPGQMVKSHLLPDLSVSVDDILEPTSRP